MCSDVLIVGHVSIDIRDGNCLPGGPPMYQIPILQYFGFRVEVLTSCTPDHPIWQLKDIVIHNIPTRTNTIFLFGPGDEQDDRELTMMKRASDLIIPNSLKLNYKIIIISAIANELSDDVMEELCNRAERSLLDTQSLFRKVSSNGIIVRNFNLERLYWSLHHFSLVKASIAEVDPHIENLSDSPLIITKGGNEIQVLSEGEEEILQFDPILNPIDTTGSGDIFLAALAVNLGEINLYEAVRVADKYARFALKFKGPLSSKDLMRFKG